MNDLFLKSGAEFSSCRKYRYALWRIWDDSLPLVMFIGLNPSTANEETNDPTIRRVIQFATDWGYGGVYMMNCFPLVSSEPRALKDFLNSVSHDTEMTLNNDHLKFKARKCDRVIFAWGNFEVAIERGKELAEIFPNAFALMINKNGSPRHPLYVKKNIKAVNYKP